MKNDIAQVRMATQKQMRDIYTTVMQGVPELSFEVASDILSKKSGLIAHTLKYFPNQEDFASPTKQWEAFYLKMFGVTVNFSGIKIPERTEAEKIEFTRLIIVLKGLALNQVFRACQVHFKCWRYTEDLNQAIQENERKNTDSYAIWVRDTVEADEVHKNKSTEMVKKEKLKKETVLERMIHELKYSLESGKHLDWDSTATLCSGSDFNEGVCCVSFVGQLILNWFSNIQSGADFRHREVIA